MCELMPAKTWKSCSDHSEFTEDGSRLLFASDCYEIPRSNVKCKRRKFLNNSAIIFRVDEKSDEEPTFSSDVGLIKTTTGCQLNNGIQAPVSSIKKPEKGGRHDSFDCELQSESSNKELNPNSMSSHCETSVGTIIRGTEVSDVKKCPNSKLEVLADDASIKDICITVLRSHGLLAVDMQTSNAISQVLENSKISNILQSCLICDDIENAQNMLICDHCEEACHVSCANMKTKMFPVDEWFCQYCSKLTRKNSLENSFWKSHGSNEGPRFELGPIRSMLKYPETYASRVRIGEYFQADVPEWSGPMPENVDCIGEPLEMDPSEIVCVNGFTTDKVQTSMSICNWLQCREVLYDNTRECENKTICGKWRRAPLSEVQTDDWDCSCSVLWDPSHSDCAVPQEVKTDQILLQLKYVEQLKSQIAPKRI